MTFNRCTSTGKNSDFLSNLIGFLRDNPDDIMRRDSLRHDKVILCRLGNTPCDEWTQLSVKNNVQSKNCAIPLENIFLLKSRETYLNGELLQTWIWAGNWYKKSSLVDFCSVGWILEITRVSVLSSDHFVLCRAVLLHFTVLSRALHLGHVGTLLSAACLKLSREPGREQYIQGSVLFKDCNVGSSNSLGLGCFTAELS